VPTTSAQATFARSNSINQLIWLFIPFLIASVLAE
jgi:hypothetical protein